MDSSTSIYNNHMQAYSYIHSSRAEKKKMLDKIILLFALFAAANAVYVSFCAGLCIGKEKGIRTQGHMYRADKNELIRALHGYMFFHFSAKSRR